MTLPDGIHAFAANDYHADCCDQPSLSASIAHKLVNQSPLHAWTAHPRLNPAFERQDSEKFDIGNALHALLLEGANGIAVIDAPDWRTKIAKEARDEARAEGRLPLLTKDADSVLEMLAAAKAQLAAHDADPAPFTAGKPEQTLVWQEDGVACRARCDWLHNDLSAIDDLKTTSRSANPEAYSRNLYSVGGDVQAAMYVRAVEKLTGRRPEFRWVVVETSPPYALSVVSPGPDVLALGEAKVEHALQLWRQCLETDSWPGYVNRVCYAELPGWEESRWLEREAREAA
jgi:hypothetical protein